MENVWCVMQSVSNESVCQYFSSPRNINVNGKLFKNVSSIDTYHYKKDNMNQTVNHLNTFDNAEHSVYETNGEIRQILTHYREPVTKEIDGRVFNNIMSRHINYESGITRYDNFNKNNLPTVIKVNKEGKIVYIDEPIEIVISRKVSNFFKKILKLKK